MPETTSLQAPPPIPSVCYVCGAALAHGQRYCGQCGKRVVASVGGFSGGLGGMKADVPDNEKWFYQPIWIGVLAFAVLGPFALPLVWKSPHLKQNGRIVYTIAILIYTVLLFWGTWALYVKIMASVNQALGSLDLNM